MTSRRRSWVLASAVLLVGGLSACAGSTTSGSEPAASTSAAPALAPSSWLLATYLGEDGAQVTAVPGTDGAPLAFAADGTFSGSTGCNRISGTFSQEGSGLTMAPGPMTMMGCPPELAVQEAALVAALPTVASFTVDGTLSLQDADGATVLTYKPGLVGLPKTSWTATGVNNGKEAVVSTAATGSITMVFGDDGTVAGTGGCNNYTGTYAPTPDGGLTFGPIAATARACADPDVDATEQAFFAALPKVTSYRLDGLQLTLLDATDATQVSLVYAD